MEFPIPSPKQNNASLCWEILPVFKEIVSYKSIHLLSQSSCPRKRNSPNHRLPIRSALTTHDRERNKVATSCKTPLEVPFIFARVHHASRCSSIEDLFPWPRSDLVRDQRLRPRQTYYSPGLLNIFSGSVLHRDIEDEWIKRGRSNEISPWFFKLYFLLDSCDW